MTSQNIGVVVPVFNRAQSVLVTLESVAKQSRVPNRLVIVDDGSSDNSAELVSRWILTQRRIPEVYLLRQENRGVSAARNRGLALMTDCTYVAFLDSDDAWPEGFLKQTSKTLVANPDAVAVTCNRRSIDVDGTCHDDDLQGLCEYPVHWIVRYGAGFASCTLIHAKSLSRIGGFREDLETGEDTALFLRLSLQGKWLHQPELFVEYNRYRPHTLGEESPLSAKYADNHRRWSLVLEEFLETEEGCGFARDPIVRKGLARFWYRAGRELAKHGSQLEAQECFSQSLKWNAWNVKTWYKLAS
ncbi:MAG: glycosyltransferase family A protein [Pirellulaceae bacterium]|nr:glycosyltransferase family A protein [Pirellulaceae bacterium]